MSLRVLAQGIAGPIYGQIFYFGISGMVEDELGATIPGLPLFVSSAVSLTAAVVSGRPAFPRSKIKVQLKWHVELYPKRYAGDVLTLTL